MMPFCIDPRAVPGQVHELSELADPIMLGIGIARTYTGHILGLADL